MNALSFRKKAFIKTIKVLLHIVPPHTLERTLKNAQRRCQKMKSKNKAHACIAACKLHIRHALGLCGASYQAFQAYWSFPTAYRQAYLGARTLQCGPVVHMLEKVHMWHWRRHVGKFQMWPWRLHVGKTQICPGIHMLEGRACFAGCCFECMF